MNPNRQAGSFEEVWYIHIQVNNYILDDNRSKFAYFRPKILGTKAEEQLARAYTWNMATFSF